MAVYDLYSKRRKRAQGQTTDVYRYDAAPTTFKNQIVHMWGETIGIPYVTIGTPNVQARIRGTYHDIVSVLRKEYGVATLAKNSDPTNHAKSRDELITWYMLEGDTDRILDAIELSFQVIDSVTRKPDYLNRRDAATRADDAIEELNARFKESGLGYQFEDGQIVRMDSALLHQEAVVPALTILRQPEYSTPQAEFLGAFEHFRHGHKSEALVDCCKAFESTMKVICDKRGWTYPPTATASTLVKTCLDNGLIPPYWQTHFSGLRNTLESAIPTPRNKLGGHGAGSAPPHEPPDELVSYVLHMTASTILFLAEAEESLP
jgi:hypothetical protein